QVVDAVGEDALLAGAGWRGPPVQVRQLLVGLAGPRSDVSLQHQGVRHVRTVRERLARTNPTYSLTRHGALMRPWPFTPPRLQDTSAGGGRLDLPELPSPSAAGQSCGYRSPRPGASGWMVSQRYRRVLALDVARHHILAPESVAY